MVMESIYFQKLSNNYPVLLIIILEIEPSMRKHKFSQPDLYVLIY